MRLLETIISIATIATSLHTSAANAESWCAYPLWVHEWGVHVFATDGTPAKVPAFPAFFHTPDKPAAAPSRTPVRALPADSGIRTLPVVHFYSAGSQSSPIPVGLEVGFSHGSAAAWYPAVDTLRTEAEANSPAARAARTQLQSQRAARQDGDGRFLPQARLSADPTRQLVWDRIELTSKPAVTPAKTDVRWVQEVRQFGALWANTGGESERFVFYEAGTTERTPLAIVRGDTFGKGRRHYIIENKGTSPVFDVFFVHRAGRELVVFHAPQIPAGKSAGFLMEDHKVKDVAGKTVDHLRRTLVDPAAADWPVAFNHHGGNCVMGRDPAIPTETAKSHHLFNSEVTAILGVWQKRFFEQQGTTILYREDIAALDAAMPLSLYTDMYNHVVLNRAGLALWEGVVLP